MKVKVDKDEYYPYWFITESATAYDTEIELTEKELRWIKRVSKAFDELQKFLEKKVKEDGD